MSGPGACSWSGGKDSALALQRAIERGFKPATLLTMLDESGRRSRSHGLPLAVLEAQADALGLALFTRSTSWEAYTDAFVDALQQLEASGHPDCIFGDIDIWAHRTWCMQVCDRAGVVAHHPLWQQDRRQLVEELIDRGFEATIVLVRAGVLDRSFLGRRVDRDVLSELEALGVDACGENGEFHTVVTDGPLVTRPVEVRFSDEYEVADCLALDVRLASLE
jgi:diphthine-ammonia ligase